LASRARTWAEPPGCSGMSPGDCDNSSHLLSTEVGGPELRLAARAAKPPVRPCRQRQPCPGDRGEGMNAWQCSRLGARDRTCGSQAIAGSMTCRWTRSGPHRPRAAGSVRHAASCTPPQQAPSRPGRGGGRTGSRTERRALDRCACLFLAAVVTVGPLIQRACDRYRWDIRPTVKRLN